MLIRFVRTGVFLMAALCAGLAMAQADASLSQVYQAANAGHLDQAQAMMKQVLRDHPGSAKAHYVEAELDARQGLLAQAREELATAERLAPGLVFAKPEAVQALRDELAPRTQSRSAAPGIVAASPAASSFPWGLVLAVAGVAVAVALFLRRKDAPQGAPYSPAPYPGSPYAAAGSVPMPQGQPPMPGYGAPAAGGSGLMGGLATGLAVGAGVVAAEEIGRRLLGGGERGYAGTPHQPVADSFEPLPERNRDMGGANFGIDDASSWDSGGSLLGSSDDGGGGGWDS
jgi:hypothetical protein